MSLTVEPANIHDLARTRLDQHADAFSRSRPYIVNNVEGVCNQAGWQGLTHLALGQHRGDVDALLTNANSGTRLLETVSDKMRRCYLDYVAADDDAAVRFDGLFAHLGTDAAYTQGAPLGNSTRRSFPSEVATIRAPAPIEGIPEYVMIPMTLFGDLVSPSFYIMKIIERIIGFDPVRAVSEWVVGDYRSISIAGDAITALGEFSSRMAELLTSDIGILFSGWTGVAAQAAEPYFREFTHLFAAQADPLSRLGALYTQLAWGAWLGAQAIVSLLEAGLDWILTKGIEALGAAAGLSTAIGDIAIVAVLEVWSDLVTVQGLVVAACFGLVSTIASTTAAFTQVSLATFKEG